MFSHVAAITGDGSRAEALAVEALHRGAGSRQGALAHSRHMAAEAAQEFPGSDSGPVVENDLRNLAFRLARTRPVSERSFVDMETRYGLDNKMLAEIFGISPSRSAELSKEISDTWASCLDPAMVAWLGPGSCSELSVLLGNLSEVPAAENAIESPPVDGGAAPQIQLASGPSVEELVTVGQAVLEHSNHCAQCEQRLATITSVRSLIASSEPLPVPPAVTRAAREARRRIPVAMPPGIESRLRGKLRPILLGGAIVMALLALLAAGGSSLTGNDLSQDERVSRLVESAPDAKLTSTPSYLAADTSTVSVANNGPTPIGWQVTSGAPWLRVEPSQGILEANQAVDLRVIYSAPPDQRADGTTLTIADSDGNRRVLRYDANR